MIKIYLRYNNIIDFSLFDFESIDEKYTGKANYVIGNIKISNLNKIQNLLPKLNVKIS